MSTVITPAEANEEASVQHRPLGWYGMIFFIASEAVFFANLIASYLYLRVRAGVWPPAPFTGKVHLDAGLSAINTVVLLSSSFPMHWAARSITKGNKRNLTRGLLLTAVLGAIFLSGQLFEYTHSDFGPGTGIFGSTFFTLTGFHGAHVTAGVLFLLVCFWRSTRGDFTKENHFAVSAVEMYWHFVDAVWIVLFTVLYLL